MKNYLTITALGFSLIACCIAAYAIFSTPKMALIDNARLVSEFQATKEAQQRLQTDQSRRKFYLDSLNLHLESEYNQLSVQKTKLSQGKFEEKQSAFTDLRNHVAQVNQLYQRDLAQSEQQIYEQVSTQLNAYVQEFAQKHGYDLLLGAAGTGNVWYVSDQEDITEAVIQYVNQRYEGYEQ